MEARKRHAQAELQRSTAITTICACANSADRDVGGAFANDVLVNLAISDDPDDQRFAQRMLNR